MGRDGAMAGIARAVTAAGGTVTQQLPIINGVAADVPAAAEPALRAAAGVVSVERDATGRLMSVDPNLGYDPQNDDGSLALTEQVIGATTSWRNGYTGKGIDIAMIDSGVSPVPGLTSGNVVLGPDLSFDSQNPNLTDLDGFGHGTHMGSIIAGRDSVQATGAGYAADTSHFYGIAPDSRLVSVKVAAADGAADVSQVIAAINWVDQNAHSNGLNIRVLNLSYGTNSKQDYKVDPLAYAAEQAWRHGIVVVVSGGNDGGDANTALADPAYDPYVLAVGASDSHGTVSVLDDTVADFNTRGPNTRHVDLVAPGVHVLGLRDPGSFIDSAHKSAEVGSRFFRGSGTSQAAAVVSGAALLIQKYPKATPDQIKRQLMSSALAFDSATNQFRGNGVVNVANAQGKSLNTSSQSPMFYGSGLGSLDAARGGSDVQDSAGNVLTGEQDVFGTPFVAATWTLSTSLRTTWGPNGSWNGTVMTGTGFGSSTWAAAAWNNATWTSWSWRGADWTSWAWRSWSWRDYGWQDSQDGDSQGTGWDSWSWRSSAWRDVTWSSADWS